MKHFDFAESGILLHLASRQIQRQNFGRAVFDLEPDFLRHNEHSQGDFVESGSQYYRVIGAGSISSRMSIQDEGVAFFGEILSEERVNTQNDGIRHPVYDTSLFGLSGASGSSAFTNTNGCIEHVGILVSAEYAYAIEATDGRSVNILRGGDTRLVSVNHLRTLLERITNVQDSPIAQ